jgi:prepilin-type N-terminal cleavage/methylation domain-containing protein
LPYRRFVVAPTMATMIRLFLPPDFHSSSPSPSGHMPLSPRRRGFTLIELLIVVVIIGILAAIAIPKFASTKGKAYFAGMQSDLHNLTTAQEAYFYDHSRYSPALDSLQYGTSQGDVVVLTEASVTGWSATATNSQSYPHFCALFFGNAAPVAPATAAGVVACQ